MRALRLRIWMILVAVALVAFVSLCVTWAQKSSRHRARAAYYATRESNNRKIAATQADLIRHRTMLITSTEKLLAGKEGQDPDRADAYRADLVRERENLAGNQKEETAIGKRIRYFVEMRRKHDRAGRFPWLPVSPDPPEPE